ncbi:MAG: hypothetical protein A2149_07640, partial [Candidatus Schekmanbacteria bacterium RBG_16_38_11]
MGKNTQKKEFKGIVLRLLLVAVLATIVYSNSFTASWHFDDYSSILDNYKTKSLLTSLRNVLSNPRGVCDLTFAVDYYFSETDVFGFHITNLAIHILSAFFVYLLIRFALTTQAEEGFNNSSGLLKNLPLIGSLLFVAHPIQTQAVTYIVQRYTSLATMFYLMALVFFIKARMNLISCKGKFFSRYHLPFYLYSLVCALLAMRTKEIAVTIPVILLLYDLIFLKKTRQSLKNTLLHLLPFFILLLIILIARVSYDGQNLAGLGEAIDRSFKETPRLTRWENAITQINVVLTYMRLILFPVNQIVYYIYPISNSIFSHYTYFSLLIHITILVAAILIAKKSKLVSFGIFWFFITISVESSIIPIRDVIFEHRLYLPSVGFVLFVAGLVLLKIEWKNVFYAFLLIVITIFSIATYNRNFVWKDDFTLWNDCLSKSKNNPRAYLNLGNFYLDKKLYDASIAKYRRALEIDPYYAEAHNNLGYAYELKGLSDLAVSEYRKALNIRPDYPQARNNLGIFYYDHGKLEEAVSEFKTALMLKPDYPKVHKNIGDIYYDQKKLEDAIKEYQIALELNPNFAEARNSLGIARTNQGRLEEAVNEFRTALKLNPDYFDARYNLGMAYYSKRMFESAIIEYQTVLRQKPDIAEVHVNLGNIYCNQGKLEEGIKEYQAALKIKPDSAEVHYNLGVAYRSKGLFNEAVEEFKNALKIKPDLIQARQAIE